MGGRIDIDVHDWKKLFLEADGQLDRTLEECQQLKALLRELHYEIDMRPPPIGRRALRKIQELKAENQRLIDALNGCWLADVAEPHAVAPWANPNEVVRYVRTRIAHYKRDAGREAAEREEKDE